ncbi:MAG: class I SAM-dependent methyltransferase [Propionibacteriales bacterium]|nr:class I SAM-dependent methyltransferase [Propionibacteriales bacterium]
MSYWEDRILPRVIEVTCSDRMTGRWRAQVCAGVSGEVLEVGFGSGTNLAHYPSGVTRVDAVEPSDLAWQRAQEAVGDFGRPVRRVGLDGAALVLGDASVDAVVSSYTMCTIPDLDGALAEFRRVLRPGGALHFVEHSAAPDTAVAAWQQRIQPVWGRIGGGCHLTRDIPALVTGAGFTLTDLDAFYAPGPAVSKPFGWMTVGRAVEA